MAPSAEKGISLSEGRMTDRQTKLNQSVVTFREGAYHSVGDWRPLLSIEN